MTAALKRIALCLAAFDVVVATLDAVLFAHGIYPTPNSIIVDTSHQLDAAFSQAMTARNGQDVFGVIMLIFVALAWPLTWMLCAAWATILAVEAFVRVVAQRFTR